MIGRPVAMHAMRGISAHSNGFHTCRALHPLQVLIGSIDAPGGFRYKPPFPTPAPPPLRPAGTPGTVNAGKPLAGPPPGFPLGQENLRTGSTGSPPRITTTISQSEPCGAPAA